MSWLIPAAILLVLISVAVLAVPLGRRMAGSEVGAQRVQYEQARDRLLGQLGEIDAQSDEGLIDSETAADEKLRLEADLAEVLRRLDQQGEEQGSSADERLSDREHRLTRWLVVVALALLLSVVTLSFYGGRQAETLLALAGVRGSVDPMPINHPGGAPQAASGQQQQFPPEVLEMVRRLEERLAQAPDDAAGWKRLGRSYTVMGRYSDAVSAYSQAAQLAPDDVDVKNALQELAQIAARGGRHPESGQPGAAPHPDVPPEALQMVTRLEQRLAENPDDAQGWARLGRAYVVLKRPQEAIEAYARANQLAPDDITLLAAYAEVVFTSNPRDPDGKALDLYRRLHQMAPRHPDGLWFMGLAAYSEGNLAQAKGFWTQLLGVLPADGEAHASVRNAIARVEILLNQQE